jgi:FkbM family methyltransferase
MMRDYVLQTFAGPSSSLLSRRAVALALSIRHSAVQRHAMTYSIDRDGDWVLRQPGATIHSATLYETPLSAIEAQVQDQWLWARDIKPGDVVVDVGAGVGDDVVVMSKKVGPAGRVIAIEAHPKTFHCLQKTIADSGLLNVTALQIAVSDAEGELKISDHDEHLENAVGVTGDFSVRARTLDAILADEGISQVGLIKINIEGAEVSALRGMRQTLQQSDQVVVSCHDFIADRGGSSSLRTQGDVLALLRGALFDIKQRPDDPRPWVRYFVHGLRMR